MRTREIDRDLIKYFEGRKGAINGWQQVAGIQAFASREVNEDLKECTRSQIRAALDRLARKGKILKETKPFTFRSGVKPRIAYHHPDLSRPTAQE